MPKKSDHLRNLKSVCAVLKVNFQRRNPAHMFTMMLFKKSFHKFGKRSPHKSLICFLIKIQKKLERCH